MKWFLECLSKKYAVVEGRARRKEYWFFTLFYCLGLIVLMIVDGITGTLSEQAGIGLLSGVFVLATLVPYIAVTVRRLHDTDRSGWWILLSLIPLIGGLVLLVFMLVDSQPGANRFGPNPKGVSGPGMPSPTA
jgi:uncharacterized membrane protein YhaH (DUF805 family)